MAKGDKIGVCPLCGGDVIENNKAYGCSNWRTENIECKFTIWKEICGRTLSEAEAKDILEKGETDFLEGFTSKKTGKQFTAKLSYKDGKLEFGFPQR